MNQIHNIATRATYRRDTAASWPSWYVYYNGQFIGKMFQQDNGLFKFTNYLLNVETTGKTQADTLSRAEWYMQQQGKSLAQ